MSEATAASLGAAGLPAQVETDGPKSVVLRSQWDTAHGVVARRSEHSAQLLRESASLRTAMQSVARWVLAYLEKHGLQPEDINVTGSMTREGVVVLQIALRGEE